MPDSENICVGCEHPIVDETIEGDMTLRVDHMKVDLKDLAMGVDSKCRNCAVILDAIVTFVPREGRSWPRTKIDVYPYPKWQGLLIDIGDKIEVIRDSDLPRDLETSNSDVWNVREPRPRSEDTLSQETIRIIQEWKTNCIRHHENCTQLVAARLPKRILEITAEHIFLREQAVDIAPYACLSHCWGPNGPAVKLTASTVERLRDGLTTCNLPKTFQDAVEVCRHLRIYYIWIDALCILQDSEEDWKEAAATMGDIYENSHLTIAATASEDNNGGLFSSDRPATTRLNKHPHLYVRRQLERFPTNVGCRVPRSMPLLTRAWVYQERRLSHRTIHFGKHQVYWECQTGFASESSIEDRTWETHATDLEFTVNLDWGDKCTDHKIYWQKTVSEYTVLQLTYESDRLPAIAAVVDRMSRLQRVDDVYIAGLWKNSILSDLLWRVYGHGPRPARMAPSWSWASAQSSEVSWCGYKFPKEAKVVSLEYAVVGAANLGEVTNASIILMVPVLNLTGFDALDLTVDGDFKWGTLFGDMLKSGPIVEQFTQNNLEMTHTRFYPDYDLTTANPPLGTGRTIKLLVARDSYSNIGGIVVQQTSENAPEYRRIGSLDVDLKKTKSEKSDLDSIYLFDKEMEGDIAHLILSLSMEEVKIV